MTDVNLQKSIIYECGYDRKAMIDKTVANPIWLHFGAGNIFRGYVASLQDELLKNGQAEKGIVAVETFDSEIINKAFLPYDNICLGVTLKTNGELDIKPVLSVAQALSVENYNLIAQHFENPSLQTVTLTVTEKGYRVFDTNGELLPIIKKDIKSGIDKVPENLICILVALIYKRFVSCAAPLAILSLDNCSENGKRLYESVIAVAKEWVKSGDADKDFIDYLSDENKVSFPWSMIDRITPSPSPMVAQKLKEKGLPYGISKTEKGSTVSPFVNMEECCYLVVEDNFPAGRPALEKAGVIFADRETVKKCESMKVYTCLNPIHTALAVLGCLLGFEYIHEEMADEDLCKFARCLGYTEMLPVAVNPEVLNPKNFIDDVLNVRLPNVNIPDKPERIATDTSQKMPVRYGNAVNEYIKSGKTDELKYIPFVFAAWCRYLTGINDFGERFTLSPDPCLDELTEKFKCVDFTSADSCKNALEFVLSSKFIGCEIINTPIFDKALEFFMAMVYDKGTVRKALKKLV